MQLNESGLKDREEWMKKGYRLPEFDRETVRKKTEETPQWIHFGAGNIVRAFQANVVQELLNRGIMDTGLIVAEGYDCEIIKKINDAHDSFSILVTLKSDGTVEKTVIGSVVESLEVNPQKEKDLKRLKEIFCADSLQIASFTITEKGYSLKGADGQYLPDVEKDLRNGPETPKSYIGKIASLLYERYRSGEKRIAMVSMDNCSHNGDRLREAMETFALAWKKNSRTDAGFLSYLQDREKVSFPWSMIDKITPRPDKKAEEILKADGIEGMEPIVTEKNTYIAPFVNAEECQYLVIEDEFPNGRPQLEAGGIFLTSREIVDRAEKMKVCTCLNPLHTALAVFGCLLGYQLISEEMKNPVLKKLIERIGYEEGLPVVSDPEILDPRKFIEEVIQIRFPNPFMPDTPKRIATDTSQKLAVRYGETIKAYEKAYRCAAEELEMIPLVIAGWIRYLMAVDDQGNPFTLSPDPLLSQLQPIVKEISFGFSGDIQEKIRPILENKTIFGTDLYEVGLASKIVFYLKEMIAGKGAVEATLKKYV
ncbi:MAG: mannitol dehydrogenase family protein [Eubacteriales bacterium]|nr:mannitol dehydrogenase family protein [Eubacteriales bacterium]